MYVTCYKPNMSSCRSKHSLALTYHNHLHLFFVSSSCIIIIIIIITLFITPTTQAKTLMDKKYIKNSTLSAIFAFGDSSIDPGNNNYILTPYRCNFPPYGKDFKDHIPSGRCTNGRVIPDFLASYIGLKEYIPPYLDPTLSMDELMTGVTFASAASGYDTLTAQLSNVIPMSEQLEYLKEYKKRLEQAIGKKRSEKLIQKAGFIVSAGTNDFVVNYLTVPIRRQNFTISSYQQFLIQQVRNFIQVLLDQGARKLGIAGVLPMGCVPIVITINSNNIGRGCIESYNSIARDYNQMLQNELKVMQNSLTDRGVRIVYIDVFNPLYDMIQSDEKFGFDVVNRGCCGTGLLEAAVLCNPTALLCPDTSKYVFWDSIHPTEKAYSIIFKGIQSIVDSFANG